MCAKFMKLVILSETRESCSRNNGAVAELVGESVRVITVEISCQSLLPMGVNLGRDGKIISVASLV